MIKEKECSGFSDNPFMIGYDNRIFERDETLGFRFPERRLISSNRFVTLEEAIKEIRREDPTILNMGDSSTSGWDSNRVFKGNPDANAPFFSYKTYSDLLEAKLRSNVLNAGVPGYTSYQGKKYLELLLRKLAKERIRVSYATIYFGNNDCTYNQFEDKVRLDGKKLSESSSGERVTLEDYKKNLIAMIDTCREYGVKPILIVPPVHYDWEPGIRADRHREESLEILNALGKSKLAQELEKARALYDAKKYAQACELDRVLPRLKQAYRKVLFKGARETKTDLIDVQSQIPLTDNAEYFADYCHPLEKVNQMIVDKVREIIIRDSSQKPSFWRIKTKAKKNEDKDLPADIYTLW